MFTLLCTYTTPLKVKDDTYLQNSCYVLVTFDIANVAKCWPWYNVAYVHPCGGVKLPLYQVFEETHFKFDEFDQFHLKFRNQLYFL